jgi:DNA-binding NarL/FixJ family response regulator
MKYANQIQAAQKLIDREIGLLSTTPSNRILLREISNELNSIRLDSEIALKAKFAAIKNKSLKANIKLNLNLSSEIKEQIYNQKLTKKELEILALLPAGQTIKELADSLFLTEATIKTHLTAIYKKLGAANRTQAISNAKKSGLLTF